MASRLTRVAISATFLLLYLNCSTSSVTNTTTPTTVNTIDTGSASPATSTNHPNVIIENVTTPVTTKTTTLSNVIPNGQSTAAPITSTRDPSAINDNVTTTSATTMTTTLSNVISNDTGTAAPSTSTEYSTGAPNDSHVISGGTTTSHSTDKEHRPGGAHKASGIVLAAVHFSHVKYPLVFTLVVMVCSISKLLFHYSHFLSSKVPESCVLIILGVVVGTILNFTGVSETITLFQPHEFFLYLLPPLVLESAFCLHDRTFADNIGGVLLFALMGTVLNCFAIGFSLFGLYTVGAMEEINCTLVQIMVFSALIVAVDPVAVLAVFQEVGVNSTLYFLVFGESLLNDGVTVVLYNVMQTFNRMDDVEVGDIFLGVVKFLIVMCGGTLLGTFMAILSAFVTRFTHEVKVIEPLMIFGFAYLSYLLAELFEFSGIISMTACGIVQAHYAFHNITKKSRTTVKFIAKVMANAAEILIFMFLGIVTIQPDHDWKTGFTLWTALLCVIFRFIFTYFLSICINQFSTSRIRKIKLDEMFMISYGGLRGAVCFSLVALIDETEIPMKNMFVTTTLFIIFQTVFLQGGTIKGLVKKLRITLAEKERDMSLNEELSAHVSDHVMAGVEEILGYSTGTNHLREKLERLDDNFVKPKLMRNAAKSDLSEISMYYEKLVMKEHLKNLQLSGARGLPRVQTEIQRLDSELALDQIIQDVDKKRGKHRRDAGNVRRNKSFSDNVHLFFSNAMHSVRSRINLHKHDKNIKHKNHKNELVKNLRRKHLKNNQLNDIMTHRDEQEMANMDNDEPTTIAIVETPASRASQVQFQLHDNVHEDGGYHENGNVTFHL